MQDGERDWDDKAFENLDRITEVYKNAIGNAIYWATGKEYAILKDASIWLNVIATGTTDKTNADGRRQNRPN